MGPKLKNQIVSSPIKTRRMTAKDSSNLYKENMAEVADKGYVPKRRRVAIKPLQEKNDSPVTANVNNRRRGATKPGQEQQHGEKNDTPVTTNVTKRRRDANNPLQEISVEKTDSSLAANVINRRRGATKATQEENGETNDSPVAVNVTKRRRDANKPLQEIGVEKTDSSLVANVINRRRGASKAVQEKNEEENDSPVATNVTKRRRDANKALQEKNDSPVAANVIERPRDAIKPLQEKNDTVEDARKRKKNERSDSLTVVEPHPTVSHVSTRNMRERRRRSKSDNSENRINRNIKAVSGTKLQSATNNKTPLKNQRFVQIRKMAALKISPKTTQILTLNNVTIQKNVAATVELECEAPTKSTGKVVFKEQRKPSSNKAVGNSSTEPVYKKKLDNNMNATVESVFDFESNSQEIIATSDEPMKDVIEKLVRENKAVVKHKATRKKGVIAAKGKVTKGKVAKGKVTKEKVVKERVAKGRVTKKIVTRSEVKVTGNMKMPFSKLSEMPGSSLESIRKTTATAPHTNIEQFVEPQVSTHYVDAIIESTDIENSVTLTEIQDDNHNVESEDVPNIKDSEDVPNIVESEDVVQVVDLDDVATSSWTKPHTPPRRLRKTYQTLERTLSKSMTPHHQSTPVRQTTNSAASPWRVPVKESPRPSIGLEFSKIGHIDEIEDNTKENEGKTNEQRSTPLQQANKAKALSDDIENCFGFDLDDSDDDLTVNDTIVNPVPKIRESLPNINSSITEALKDRRRANKQPKGKYDTKIIKKPTATLSKQPEIVTDNEVGNFGNGDVAQNTEIQSDQVKKNKNEVSPKRSYFQRLSILHRPDKNTQKPSTSKTSDDGPVLFETNWPTWEGKIYRSYTRVPKQKCNSITSDDESEAGVQEEQRNHKRTKQKEDPKHKEELRKFEEEFNSSCMEVEKYDLVTEVSK